jgi:NAD+ diphosphatase
LSAEEWSELGARLTDLVFLGISEELSFFALDVTEAPPEIHERLALFGTFASMRKLSPSLPQATWEMIAQACSLSRWNRTARFCLVCGAPMVPRDAGYVRICSNEDCAATEFPRIDPAIIVRVMSADRCLLARQSKFAPGLRSVIAGFVEPGETLEAAVAREVREEVGLDVGGIAYAGSQPWPFPRALMLGFVANAVEPRICIDDREIEAADWYTRDRVRRELSAGTLSLPSTRSIARFLIDDWLDEKG